LGSSAARLGTRTEECNAWASLCRMKCRGAAKARPLEGGASEEGAELRRGDPITRDLCVGRMKPLETEVEVRSSADPQIACATCV